jgi:hypothetical protein
MLKLVLACLPALVLAATTALAADSPAASTRAMAPAAKALPPREIKAPRKAAATAKARIARGDIVPAYASAWKPEELAALRPGVAALRPRARTNQE